MKKRTFGALAAIFALVFGGLVVPTAAMAAGDDAVLSNQKSVVGSQTQFRPGDRFDYEILVGCSSTTSPGCIDAFLVDTLPAPLVLDPDVEHPVVASIGSDITFTTDENGRESFRVDGKETFGTGIGAGTGIAGGGSMLVTVSVYVPTTTSGEYNGETITNTATVDAANAPEVDSSADVTLAVTTTLAPALKKTVAPSSTIPAVPGRAVDWTLKPGNSSNQSVDTITVQDPANPPLASLGFLDMTSVDITDPAGTTGKVVEYFVAGAWTATAPAPLSGADGVRVTFTGSFAPGVSGEVVVHSETNDTVTSIAKDQKVTITNDAQSTVSKGGTTSAPVKDTASIVVANQDPDVAVTKDFARSALVSGQSTTATIVATVGAQSVKELKLTEPSAGQPNFTAQGLTFDGFGSALEWPEGATSATIEYTYAAGCPASGGTSTTVHTLTPPTPGRTVEGFTITFSAAGDDIPSRAYANLPLKVTALPVTTPGVRSGTNHVDVRVENVDGASGVAKDDAGVTVSPLVVDTEVSKSITPEQVFGVPGTDALVTLTSKVT